ncbi:hypothetical protein Hanom_Chr00s000002g01600731 [Helianthus anomalus]
MWRPPIRLIFCNFFNKLPSQATPQPKPRHTPRTRDSPVGGLQLHVSTHAPNPSPTIPHGLTRLTILSKKVFHFAYAPLDLEKENISSDKSERHELVNQNRN